MQIFDSSKNSSYYISSGCSGGSSSCSGSSIGSNGGNSSCKI